MPGTDVHRRPEHLHLRRRHQPCMIVLVASEGQAVALDRIRDEADRAVVQGGRLECVKQARQVVPAQIAHEHPEFRVVAPFDQARDGALVAEIVDQALAPCSTPLKRQCGVELVRAMVDPVAQPLATWLGKSGLLQGSVFQDHHVPAEVGENQLELVPKALANDGVKRLPVIVDDPPAIAQPVLPALDQGLVDIAFVHLGIADERDHAALRTVLHPAA